MREISIERDLEREIEREIKRERERSREISQEIFLDLIGGRWGTESQSRHWNLSFDDGKWRRAPTAIQGGGQGGCNEDGSRGVDQAAVVEPLEVVGAATAETVREKWNDDGLLYLILVCSS